MEPFSKFYAGPVVVPDVQYLYPSMMIAHNHCYSTFLVRITPWRSEDKMGFTRLHCPPRLLEFCEKNINSKPSSLLLYSSRLTSYNALVAPSGVMYINQTIPKSFLGKVLTEILNTRIIMKNSMKHDKNDKILQMLLNSRQLAPKLIRT